MKETMHERFVKEFYLHRIPKNTKQMQYIEAFISKEITLAKEEERKEIREYRDHLCFLYRWISRLNGDKEHDTPEKSWKEYVAVIVNYPLAPWNTGDWFEDDIIRNKE